MTILRAVLDHLERKGVPHALIGGAALAMRGISRSTLDDDLLAVDPRLLSLNFWSDAGDPRLASVEIARGDPDDPLLGVARFRVEREVVDVVLVRGAWVAGVLDRRDTFHAEGGPLPVVEAADLILLKLVAGGPQDLLDVRLLLSNDPTLAEVVGARIAALPSDAREAWRRLGQG